MGVLLVQATIAHGALWVDPELGAAIGLSFGFAQRGVSIRRHVPSVTSLNHVATDPNS